MGREQSSNRLTKTLPVSYSNMSWKVVKLQESTIGAVNVIICWVFRFIPPRGNEKCRRLGNFLTSVSLICWKFVRRYIFWMQSEEFQRLQRRIELALEENTSQRNEINQLTEQMKLLHQRLRIMSGASTSSVRFRINRPKFLQGRLGHKPKILHRALTASNVCSQRRYQRWPTLKINFSSYHSRRRRTYYELGSTRPEYGCAFVIEVWGIDNRQSRDFCN